MHFLELYRLIAQELQVKRELVSVNLNLEKKIH